MAISIIRIPAEVPPAPSDLTVIPATTPLRLDENTFKASVFKGDWKNARNFIPSDGDLLTTPISVHSRIALHVAACEGYWEFLEELVKIMSEKDLEMSDALGCTALHYAAVGGSIRACKALVRRNRNLTQLTSNYGWTPVLSAAQCAPKDKDVVCYLSSVTTDDSPGHPFSGNLAGILAYSLAAGGFHVVPVEFKLTTPRSERVGVYHFPVSSTTYRVVGWPEKLLWNCIGLLAPGIKEVHDAKLTHKFALELVKSVVVAFSPLSDSRIYEFFLQSDIITKAAGSGIVEICQLHHPPPLVHHHHHSHLLHLLQPSSPPEPNVNQPDPSTPSTPSPPAQPPVSPPPPQNTSPPPIDIYTFSPSSSTIHFTYITTTISTYI
ncbi:hypothetical protein Pint_01669 [Pistacia integerrima]|uniref:Uncharacterized protein n=1 Tax=Pistacia integerrima TaxID=434235 RepID=A0ACC0ZIG0_9ROSI|nr:hypothetical protein Pint_01669 [Pistacia integerrima]